MSLKDKIRNIKLDDVKEKLQEGVVKAKEVESRAEGSQAGAKTKEGFGQLRDAAKDRFGKK